LALSLPSVAVAESALLFERVEVIPVLHSMTISKSTQAGGLATGSAQRSTIGFTA
jgi:hypothetical protein